jgi:hypothetical protein
MLRKPPLADLRDHVQPKLAVGAAEEVLRSAGIKL